MANLSFYASEIDDILGRADKATVATALTSTDTLAGLGDGLYTATAAVASAISDSPVSVAFMLRVLADMYILILADGSDIYTGVPGSWHKSSSGEDTTARTAIAGHIADKANPHEVTKVQIGLGNVDNTSDADKPVSTAARTEFIIDRNAISELIDSGTKNLLQTSCSSQTVNGVVFTVNDDGTITAEIPDGITANAQLELLPSVVVPESFRGKSLILSGSPTGGSTSTWRMVLQNTTSGFSTLAANEQGGTMFTVPDSVTRIRLVFTVYANCPAQTITIKPMVCAQSIWHISQQYVPYRPSYDELVARIEALEQAAGINSVRSIANLTAETLADTAETEDEEVK